MWEVRTATHNNVTGLLQLSELMFNESQFSQYDMNVEKLRALYTKIIDSPNGILLVAVDGDELIGMFIGWVEEHWFGNTNVSNDLALYVRDDYRERGVGAQLLKQYEEHAKALGADEITLGNSTGIEIEKAVRVFQAAGFIKYGYCFRKNVQGVVH